MRKDELIFLRKIAILLIFILLLTVSTGCFLHYKKYHYIYKGKTVAKVGNTKIYEKELYSRLSFLAKQYNDENLKINDLDEDTIKALLMEIYANRKIYKLAKKSKNTINIYDLKFLAKEYYERLIREKFLNDNLFSNITEDEIQKKYNELVEMVEGKEERKISHIVLKTEEEALRIKNIVLMRNNFEKMAEQKSLDTESAINGGCIGYILKEEIAIAEFAEVAFLLKQGEMSRPIETENGWHIIRVDDIRKIKIKSYEEAREEILEKIRQDKFDSFIEGTIGNPNIEIFMDLDENIKSKNTEKNNEESIEQEIESIKK